MKETIFDIANRLYPNAHKNNFRGGIEKLYRKNFLEGAAEQAKLSYTREEVLVVTSEMLMWIFDKIKNPTNTIDPETEFNRIIKKFDKE